MNTRISCTIFVSLFLLAGGNSFAAEVPHGSLSLKGGYWKLQHVSQNIDGIDHQFDERARTPFGFEFSYGTSSSFYGWIEILSFASDFNTPSGSGSIHPLILGFGLKKIFDLGVPFRPYVGGGLSLGIIPSYKGERTRDLCLADCIGLQYVVGLEASFGQWDKVFYYVEYKLIPDLGAMDQETGRVYDVSGSGVFIGVRLLMSNLY